MALLGLVDWLGYHHLVTHGYDHTLLALALLNIGVFFGIYYLVLRPSTGVSSSVAWRVWSRQQRIRS